MRCRVLGLTLFIVNLAMLTNAAIARERRVVVAQATNCTPAVESGRAANSPTSAAPSSLPNPQSTDPRVETLNLEGLDGAPFRLCVVCPKDSVVIINGRVMSSTEKIRQYDISVPRSILQLEVLVLQDGLDLLLHDVVPAIPGESRTILVPSVISAELKKLRSTAEALEARKREVDKLQAERNKHQDERDKLQQHRDQLQSERDALQSRRDKLQTERETKK